jgi:hypothetical protein
MTNNQTNPVIGSPCNQYLSSTSSDSTNIDWGTSINDCLSSIRGINIVPIITGDNAVLLNSSLTISPSTNDVPLETMAYLWTNYANSFNLLDAYEAVKKYEEKYKMTSEEFLEKWKSNNLPFINSEINDWISLYLQIREFIIKKNEFN